MTLRRRQILRGAATLGVVSAFPVGLTACAGEPVPAALGTIVDGGLVSRVFDLRGMSWVLLPHDGRIEIRDADDVLVGTVNDLAFPTALAFDSAGRAWVVEVGAARLARIDIDRGELTRFAEGSLRCPRDVAIDGEGRVLVADVAAHRIARFDDRGRAIDLIGTPVTETLSHEEGSLNGPRSLALASDGSLLIVEAGERRVTRLASDGAWLETVSTDFLSPRTVRVAPGDGRFAVSDAMRAEVYVHASSGARIAAHHPERTPESIAFAPNGALWISGRA